MDAVVEKVVAADRSYMESRVMAETSAAGRLRAYIVTHPVGLAIDASGKLYVANAASPPSILVFDTAHGNAVLPPITGAGLNVFTGVGLNGLGGVALAA